MPVIGEILAFIWRPCHDVGKGSTPVIKLSIWMQYITNIWLQGSVGSNVSWVFSQHLTHVFKEYIVDSVVSFMSAFCEDFIVLAPCVETIFI